MKFEKIFCSDLNRCKQTLEGILKEQSNKTQIIEFNKKLREINAGKLEGKPV